MRPNQKARAGGKPAQAASPAVSREPVDLTLFFDGGCKPNPGKMEVAVSLEVPGGEREMLHDRIGHGSNNQAEWIALLWAMEVALARGAKRIEIIGDSKLVISQATRVWACRSGELKPFLEEYDRLVPSFESVVVRHVRRHENVAGHHIEAVN